MKAAIGKLALVGFALFPLIVHAEATRDEIVTDGGQHDDIFSNPDDGYVNPSNPGIGSATVSEAPKVTAGPPPGPKPLPDRSVAPEGSEFSNWDYAFELSDSRVLAVDYDSQAYQIFPDKDAFADLYYFNFEFVRAVTDETFQYSHKEMVFDGDTEIGVRHSTDRTRTFSASLDFATPLNCEGTRLERLDEEAGHGPGSDFYLTSVSMDRYFGRFYECFNHYIDEDNFYSLRNTPNTSLWVAGWSNINRSVYGTNVDNEGIMGASLAVVFRSVRRGSYSTTGYNDGGLKFVFNGESFRFSPRAAPRTDFSIAPELGYEVNDYIKYLHTPGTSVFFEEDFIFPTDGKKLESLLIGKIDDPYVYLQCARINLTGEADIFGINSEALDVRRTSYPLFSNDFYGNKAWWEKRSPSASGACEAAFLGYEEQAALYYKDSRYLPMAWGSDVISIPENFDGAGEVYHSFDKSSVTGGALESEFPILLFSNIKVKE